MLRLTRTTLALFITLFAFSVEAQDLAVCSSSTNVERSSVISRFLAQFRLAQFIEPPLPPQFTPIPQPRPHIPMGPMQDPECIDEEERLGYYRFKHCDLHPFYQVVFPKDGCNCSTGQCRPTEWRPGPVTAEYPDGIEIYVSGGWYPVKREVLRKFYAKSRTMPEPLLQYEAHVCASEPVIEKGPDGLIVIKLPDIECAWIKMPS